MKAQYLQVSSLEQAITKNWKGPDYRQAQAVLKYRPDIIIFEYANEGKTPDTIYNKYPCSKKPLERIRVRQKYLKRLAKNYPEALADIPIWSNIVKLWKQGRDIKLYNVDSPRELRAELYEVWKGMYPCAMNNWLWWVQVYLREKIMAKNIKWLLANQSDARRLKIAVFLQKFHWDHVKFLMTNPSKKRIWVYYFGKFKDISPSNINLKIKSINKVFYKYWQHYSDFVAKR